MNIHRKNTHTNSSKKEVIAMELKGSRTEANLMTAFAGESQARNKYTFYGATAQIGRAHV